MTLIAIVYDSSAGRTGRLARAMAEGAGRVQGADVVLAAVPPLSGEAPQDGASAASADLLARADGIALGTPVHLGAPSAALMGLLATTGRLWLEQGLEGRVGTAFAGAGSGGGAETTLATLHAVMAVHGMVVLPGLPRALEGPGGCSPLGAVALAGSGAEAIAAEDARAAAQGEWLARAAGALRALR